MLTLTALGTISLAATDAQEAVAAQEAFVSTHKCSRCHSVAGAGIEATSEKMMSMDLTGYDTDDVVSLGRFLRREEEQEGVKHKKPFKGTDDELQQIVDWLADFEPSTGAESPE